jgi:hypothetical protein
LATFVPPKAKKRKEVVPMNSATQATKSFCQEQRREHQHRSSASFTGGEAYRPRRKRGSDRERDESEP